jgi:hypothetical protein
MPTITPGPIVLHSDIEAAVRDTMRHWVPHYLADIDAQQGRARGTTQKPRTWDIASDNDTRWLEETPPRLLVACPGTIGEPELHGDAGSYGAWWQGSIGIAVGGATEAGSRALAGRHAGAILYTLAQQGDMGGLAAQTRWGGTRTDVAGRDRNVVACEVPFRLYVERVVDTRGLIPRDLPAVPTDPAAPTTLVSGSRLRVTGRP